MIYPQLLVAPVPSVSHSTHMYTSCDNGLLCGICRYNLYLHMCVSSHAGSPLTVNQLVVAVSTVTDWHGLGLKLGLTMSQLEQIEQHIVCQVQGPSRLMAEMLNVWLKSSPTASWADLITALKAIGQNKVANDVKTAYSPTGMDICIAATVVVSIVVCYLFQSQNRITPSLILLPQNRITPSLILLPQNRITPSLILLPQNKITPSLILWPKLVVPSR